MNKQGVRWTAAALTLLAAAALIVQTLALYRAGVSPENMAGNGVYIQPVYSRQNVSQKLAQIAPLLIAWLAASVLGAAWVKESDSRVRPPKEAPAWQRTAGRCAAAFCAIMILGGLLVPDRFASWDLERVMGGLMAWVVPWSAAGWLALSAAGEKKASQKREKSCPAAVRAVIAAVGVVCLLLGIANQGARDVWVKAINICTECIGLG